MKIINKRNDDFDLNFDDLEIGAVFEAKIENETYYYLKLRRIEFRSGMTANALRLDNMIYESFITTKPVRLLNASIVINS
ncbi:MAG: hypothetical protein J6T10_32175 [Methanobrevibacter sp.]|nr:hypothetical protein [Methanobrevibacter sp.]